MPESGDTPPESRQDMNRFEVELEFLQCLASPTYLHFLAQNQHFQDKAFLRYLKYLLYWTDPAYAKFVAFPHALYFLQLLQEESFREALKSPSYALMLHQQQGYHWQFSASSAFRPHNPNEQPVTPPPNEAAISPSIPDPSPSTGLDTPAPTPAPSHGFGMTPGHTPSQTPADTPGQFA